MRIKVPPFRRAMFSQATRTVGMALPPCRIRSRPTVLRLQRLDPPVHSAHLRASVQAESQPQSPNMRILGRARAPQFWHAGNGGTALMVVGSISTAIDSGSKSRFRIRSCTASHRRSRGPRRSEPKPARWNWPSTLEVKTKPPCFIRPAQRWRIANSTVRTGPPIELHAVSVGSPMPAWGPRQTNAGWPARRSRARAARTADKAPEPLLCRGSRAARCLPPCQLPAPITCIGRADDACGSVKGVVDHQESLLPGPNCGKIFRGRFADTVVREDFVSGFEPPAGGRR